MPKEVAEGARRGKLLKRIMELKSVLFEEFTQSLAKLATETLLSAMTGRKNRAYPVKTYTHYRQGVANSQSEVL